MPPSKEFVGLVSEYVHTVAHGDDAGCEAGARELAGRTWSALKRSAKAGPRRTVRPNLAVSLCLLLPLVRAQALGEGRPAPHGAA
jgi:hypothetical protein